MRFVQVLVVEYNGSSQVVGAFSSLDAAKEYATKLKRLLPHGAHVQAENWELDTIPSVASDNGDTVPLFWLALWPGGHPNWLAGLRTAKIGVEA